MLGKLFKNEFGATWKLMVIAFAVIIGLTEITSLFDRVGFYETALYSNPFVNVAVKTINAMFILSIIFVCLFVLVSCCMRFYKTMYSEQGYLTHTLPVSPIATFFVKFITSLVWMIASFFSIVIAVLIRIAVSAETNLFSLIHTIVTHLGDEEFIDNLQNSAQAAFGCGAGMSILIVILLFIMGFIYLLSWLFTSMTLGQLSTNHKVGLSIGIGFGLYLAGQIAGVITIVKAFNLLGKSVEETVIENAVDVSLNGKNVILLITLFMGAVALVELAVDTIVVKKKINLQ